MAAQAYGGLALALALLTLLALPTRGVAVMSEERALKSVLERLRDPTRYDVTVRPSTTGGATKVNIQTYFRDIDIDDVGMKASFDITFRMIWNDTRLIYGPPGFRGVEYVTLLDPSLVWLPDAFFKNAKAVQAKSIHPEMFLRVHPDGRLIYSTRISLEQSCPMNLNRFPHDTQTCNVLIASYGYTVQDIDFSLAPENAVTFGEHIHADRFKFEKFGTGDCSSKTSTGDYSCVQVSMKIRRVFESYLYEWYFPTMFLVAVAWFSFLIPVDQFLGRLLLTLVPLITMASFSNVYKESLASVPYVRALDIFTGISVIVVFLTLLYVILSHVRAVRAREEKDVSSEDDVEGKGTAGQAEGNAMMRLAKRILQRADYLSRVLLISAYLFFLFVYFVAYCGTG